MAFVLPVEDPFLKKPWNLNQWHLKSRIDMIIYCRLARIKNDKKKKERERKEQELNARKHLSNVRVVQKNLVYVLGLPPNVCSEDVSLKCSYKCRF
jgi:hypothetical protein